MPSRGTSSRQQSIESIEAVPRHTETPLTSLVSFSAQSIASLTAIPLNDASSTNNLLTLFDDLHTPCPPKQNEYNFHDLLNPHKPTRPSKTTREDGLSSFAQYLRDPVCQQPRQYTFPTSFTQYNTQDTFDWKDPGCRWWVRELWLREISSEGKQSSNSRRSNIFEQTKLWRYNEEEALHYKSDHISDSRRLLQGVPIEDKDECRQILALIEGESRQLPGVSVRAGSSRGNQMAGSNRPPKTIPDYDPRVSVTLEYVSATLERHLRAR